MLFPSGQEFSQRGFLGVAFWAGLSGAWLSRVGIGGTSSPKLGRSPGIGEISNPGIGAMFSNPELSLDF